MSDIEVLETTTELVEVVETGPQGPKGADGEVLTQVITSADATQVIPLYDGSAGTHVVVDFGTFSDEFVQITSAGLTVLKDLKSFTASIEVNSHAEHQGVSKEVILSMWTEISSDGITWVVVPGSLRKTTVEDLSSNTSSLTVSDNVGMEAGTQMRIVVTKLGDTGTDLTIEAPSDVFTVNGLADGFSAKAVMLYKPTTDVVATPALPYISRRGLVFFA